MGDPRPVSTDPTGAELTQPEQAEQLTATGNGPELDNEEELLAAMFGEPVAGVYAPYEPVTDSTGGADAP